MVQSNNAYCLKLPVALYEKDFREYMPTHSFCENFYHLEIPRDSFLDLDSTLERERVLQDELSSDCDKRTTSYFDNKQYYCFPENDFKPTFFNERNCNSKNNHYKINVYENFLFSDEIYKTNKGSSLFRLSKIKTKPRKNRTLKKITLFYMILFFIVTILTLCKFLYF